MIETNQFKKGLCFVYKGDPVIITSVHTSTPTARGSNTIAKTRMKNLETGQVLNASIRSGEKFEEVDLAQHPVSYLYSDGTRWYFMDDETYEQFDLGAEDLGDDRYYLVDGIEAAQLKPATTETGLVLQVPPYLASGERVRVDTRDGHFVERVKE